MFLLINFWKELREYSNTRKYFVLGMVIFIQVVVFFTIKLFFFEKIIDEIQVVVPTAIPDTNKLY